MPLKIDNAFIILQSFYWTFKALNIKLKSVIPFNNKFNYKKITKQLTNIAIEFWGKLKNLSLNGFCRTDLALAVRPWT